jgi:hypothetical protein
MSGSRSVGSVNRAAQRTFFLVQLLQGKLHRIGGAPRFAPILKPQSTVNGDMLAAIGPAAGVNAGWSKASTPRVRSKARAIH